MFSIIKDLPDGALGIAAAASLHFGVCYTVLAPRAMEAEFGAEIIPSCTAVLSTEQEGAIENAEADDRLTRSRAMTQLNHIERQIAILDQATGFYLESGIGELMGGIGVPMQDVSEVEVIRLRDQAGALRTALDRAPDFSHLRASTGQILQTCSCAALSAASGKRTSYALSLATFRLVEPEDISAVSAAARRIAEGDQCGQLPWRTS